MKNPFRFLHRHQEEDVIRRILLWFTSPEPLSAEQQIEPRARILRAWAEALLFSQVIGMETPELKEEWKRLRPFGEKTPTLDELLNCQSIACACFPTIVQAEHSTDKADQTQAWRIYVINDSPFTDSQDHRRFLSDTECIGKKQSVFLSCDFLEMTEAIDGNSWQLAFAMAARAMLHKDIRKELACNWLLTGKVHDKSVEKVCIDAKDKLFATTKRRILLPEKNKSDLIESRDNHDIHLVSTCLQAWNIISGRGIDKAMSVSLPDNPRLHVLVGGTLQPVLSVILLLNPSEVMLWHSAQTHDKAVLIQGILKSISGFEETVELKQMDSHDLSQAYSTFDKGFEQAYDDHIICNTGGNRLMGIAALLVAQAHRIKVVYRDVDAKNDTLTVIQFGEGNRYQSNDCPINRCPFHDKINWNWLYGKPNRSEKKTETVEAIAKLLLK